MNLESFAGRHLLYPLQAMHGINNIEESQILILNHQIVGHMQVSGLREIELISSGNNKLIQSHDKRTKE